MYSRKSSTVSEQSTTLSRRLRSQSAASKAQTLVVNEQSLLHWYKSHHSGLHSPTNVIVFTEESENEYTIDDPRYQLKSCYFLCNPYARCYWRMRKVRAYRHFLQDALEEVFKTLRWIDLPGGQNRVALERNYIMNYIWLVAFIVSEVDTTNKDSARHIRFRLEELLIQAENLGIILQRLFSPLQFLAQKHAVIEEMGDLLQYKKIGRPRVEKKILRLDIKPDNTMLSGNKVDDFSKLLIYVRKDCQVWTRFRTLTESDKVDIVTKGLMEIADNLKELRGSIKKPLRAIKAAGGNILSPQTAFIPSLVPHVQQMKKDIKIILGKNGNILEGEDRLMLEAILNETSTHYAYALKYGEMLVEEVWDIILMARLSYEFIKDSPQNNINAASYEAVLLSKFRMRKIKKLLKQSNFSPDDFFKADCPDTLRKLPVVVVPANAELSLHLQGHRNSQKSKVSTPTHTFSFKRKTSAGVSKLHADLTSVATKDPNQLLFVSEGD